MQIIERNMYVGQKPSHSKKAFHSVANVSYNFYPEIMYVIYEFSGQANGKVQFIET